MLLETSNHKSVKSYNNTESWQVTEVTEKRSEVSSTMFTSEVYWNETRK